MGASRMDHDFSLSEETEISWQSFMRTFEDEIWPIFRDKGFTKDAVLIAWSVNHCVNELNHISDILEERQ